MEEIKPIAMSDLDAIHTYRAPIRRYILKLVRNPSEADDLTQETFIRAFRNLGSLRTPEALSPWLYRIATHVCLDFLRKRSRSVSRNLESDRDGLEWVERDAPSLHTEFEKKEMSACVQRYLERLADSYRAVIILHDLEGLSALDISELLGLSLTTTKMRLHRARRALQADLEAGCTFSCNDQGTYQCEPNEAPPQPNTTRDVHRKSFPKRKILTTTTHN